MEEKDFLTNCLNKESIEPMFDRIRADCRRNHTPFSVLVLDLDHFKSYNDKYGHISGDEALKYFASTLRLTLGDSESFIFRFGGDEFIIAFPGKGAKEANLIAKNLIGNLRRRPFITKGCIFRLSVSGGIASYPNDGNDIDTIIQKADKAMYCSKMSGRWHVTLYKHVLRNKLKALLNLIVYALIIAAAVFYFQQTSVKSYAAGMLAYAANKANIYLARLSDEKQKKGLDIIHLKSGRMIHGIILRDKRNSIDVALDIDEGSGIINISKSSIDNISKSLNN